MVDLHRHDEFSTFDGFGKAVETAKTARELGYTSLGLSNHGNTTGLVKHYDACKAEGIKPILGVETYFLPKYKDQSRGYHLCLFAKDAKGYENVNRCMYLGEYHKYYNSIVDLKTLEENSEGVICSTACVASYFSQAIIKGEKAKAVTLLKKFKSIYGDDFYIEIQPYKIDKSGTQETVNITLINIADKLGIKCILTSDSHYCKQDDFPTYLKMHEIAKHQYDVESTYRERYMPTEAELISRFVDMHTNDFGKESKRMAKKMIRNLEEIEAKVDGGIFDSLEENLPVFDEEKDSRTYLHELVKAGLKSKGISTKEYRARAKEELDVIAYHGFEDYFLMVRDYVQWAKSQGISIGPGRGSACNCLASYAAGITDVDPIKFGLDYHRFIRPDKKKMPDIDLDFETSRRAEVIEYLLDKYQGRAAQIISYGLYKVDNLINDLAKVCGLDSTGKVEISEKARIKEVVKSIKSICNKYIDDQMGTIRVDALYADHEVKMFNKQYDNIITHFVKLYRKVRFVGTHAAGVAIVGSDLLKYAAVRLDSKSGKRYISYDLVDAERLKIVKFDILGLKTMESLGELRRLTGRQGIEINYQELIDDTEVMEGFRKANTDGIFQFESSSAKTILETIEPENFDDITAASSLNRPGPLSMRMHEQYKQNKDRYFAGDLDLGSSYNVYLKDTYGTLIYQEQVQAIATNVGKMKWEDADKIIKLGSGGAKTTAAIQYKAKLKEYEEEFAKNAKAYGIDKEEASHLFHEFFNYSFNKGHSTGYSLISIEEMWYKVHYPTFYWFVKMRDNLGKDDKIRTFCENATYGGAIVFLPHANYSAAYSLRKFEGEYVIQQGLDTLKGVGQKAAEYIEAERKANGRFKDYDDFYDRCKSRTVTSRVIDVLKDNGALEFNKQTYLKRVTKYGSALYMRGESNAKDK